MTADRTAALQVLRAFCQRHPSWVLFDEPTCTLLEVASGKRLALLAKELTEVLERVNAETNEPYLLVEFGDGRELALGSMGVAFPPVAPDVPQAPPLPPVVCLADFGAVFGQLQHVAVAHRDQKLDRTGLDMMMLALGILDGARRVGFDVGEEERALEAVLTELERRR